MGVRAIVHLNIIGFKSAVAAIKDKSLIGRPYVIAGATGGRSLALDCSPEAIRQGVTPGTALAVAEGRIKDLMVLPTDIPAYEIMNTEIEQVVNRYAPVWENDRMGNLYLDISGTTKIFGSPADCSTRILRDILEKADIRPVAAVSINKLVSKVATRTIRPKGLIQIQNGTEADFLSHQHIALLPGMGTKLMRTAMVTGIKEIGEVAALSTNEAVSLFGKHGLLLRNFALGIDDTKVTEANSDRRISRQADFDEDVIDETSIRGVIETLAAYSGLEMRKDKLATTKISLVVVYSDGIRAEAQEKLRRPCVLDKDISHIAERIFNKTAVRRIRIRSIGLSLEWFVPLGYQPDLFEPETDTKNRKLQEAVDKIQNRYGAGKVTKGIVLAASKIHNEKRLLSTGTAYVH
jgi:DNA polymerase-4